MPCYNTQGQEVPAASAQVCTQLGGRWGRDYMQAVGDAPLESVSPETLLLGGPVSKIAKSAYRIAQPSISAGASNASKYLSPLFDKLFKTSKPLKSKGTGKTPKGDILYKQEKAYRPGMPKFNKKTGKVDKTRVPFMRNVLDSKGNPIPLTGRALSFKKAAVPVGLGALGATGLYDNTTQQTTNIPEQGLSQITDRTQPPTLNLGTGTTQPSIWDEMKTKDYWQKSMSGMPGDTRLSRIGQLMSYYGTPQAQRGVDPAGGFASRDFEAAQLIQKQLAAKQAQTQEPVDIFSNIGNATMVNAVKQKVAKAMGKDDWLSLDPKDEDVVATANEVVIEIRSKMQKINPDTGTYYTFAEAEKITLRAVE